MANNKIDKSKDIRMTGNILTKQEGYISSAEIDGLPDLVLTIDYVTVRQVPRPGKSGTEELPIIVFRDYPEDLIIKAAAIRKTIASLYGQMVEGWSGRRIAIYCEHGVRNPQTGKLDATGLRVRPYIPAVDSATCEDCGEDIKPAAGKTVAEIVSGTEKAYGRCLCMSCARKAKKAKEKAEKESQINYL